MYTAIIQLLSLAVAVAAAPTTTACNRDNCLRAVAASAFPTRLGTQDCSSYFLVTVTPPTSTQTQLFVVDTTATNIYTTTQTSIETDIITTTTTATVLSDISITNTATEIDTIAQTTTISATETITDYLAAKKQRDIANRQVTISPSGIPSYASACSGSVRYSSACSCLGVTRSTITAPSPITTITITTSTSITLVVPTTTSVTSTYDVVLTDSTDITAFVTETASATITIDVSVTVSDTVTATQTAFACATSDAFYLLATSTDGDVNGKYGQVGFNDGSGYIGFTSSLSDATIFQIDADGHLIYNGLFADVLGGFEASSINFDTPADISSNGESYIQCSLSSSGSLSVTGGGYTVLSTYDFYDQGTYAILGSDQNFDALSLQAVCAS